MKVSPRTYKLQWDLHSWVGLLVALPAFVMFFCGVFALFQDELTIWQDPDLHVAPDRAAIDYDALVEKVQVSESSEDSELSFSRNAYTRLVRAKATTGPDEPTVLWLDPVTGNSVAKRSKLASALFGLHFFEPLPAGMQLSGLFGVALLVLSISGLLLIARNFARQWWQFRPNLRRRLWAADAHKTLGGLALPFLVMMAWSGATLALGGVVGAGLTMTNYGGDFTKVQELRGYDGAPLKRTGTTAKPRPLNDLIAAGQAHVGTTAQPEYVGRELWGDENAWAFLYFGGSLATPWQYVYVQATDARVLQDTSAQRNAPRGAEETLFSLHFAWFGGIATKVCYSVLSLGICILIVLGQLLWLERRNKTGSARGQTWLGRATLGVCAGLVLACAGYFTLNRLLPWTLANRAVVEWNLFLVVWGIAFVGAFVQPAKVVATRYLWLAGIGFASVVVIDLFSMPANLFTAYSMGLDGVGRVEALLVVMAGTCWGAAWLMSTWAIPDPKSPQRH